MPTASPMIGVHLDLKGVVFKPSYFPQLMRDLAAQKVNTVLVEYEDIFPFRGIGIGRRPEVWSQATLRKFLSETKKNNIEVIPLQQCLGHLEYLLGWKKYRHLAEKPNYPSTIKVDDSQSTGLILEMLRQVAAAHPDSRYIHLGMDEAHALHDTARRQKRDVLDVFLDHLRNLLAVVEPMGKIPMIWTDMLEDHFRPDAFADLKGRVIFTPWEYSALPRETTSSVRLVGGFRVSKTWLEEPENPLAPAIGGGTKFLEDHSPDVLRLLAPYQRDKRGREFMPLPQIDLWTKLGMKCVGASGLRISAHHQFLPDYNALLTNLVTWSKAIKRTGQVGQIGTSWARGTSWCPPNYSIDLQWWQINKMSESMGASPRPFFPGIPQKEVDRIFRTLGRSRDNWRLEGAIAAQMEKLSPKIREHRYEWDSTALMARALELVRRADYNLEEVDYFNANTKPTEDEWQRRIDEQNQTLHDITALRKKIKNHFGRRYAGEAHEEWVRHLFDLRVSRIKAGQKICLKKKAIAKKYYAQKLK